MVSHLQCASCGRIEGEGSNGVRAITYQGMKWCASCAAIGQTVEGSTYVSSPSPGRIYEGDVDELLTAWRDCYETRAKKRILVKDAKKEIQRAWELWKGNKTSGESMLLFFGWLKKHRPYFLTFRNKEDPWQKVHSWLIQYENQRKR